MGPKYFLTIKMHCMLKYEKKAKKAYRTEVEKIAEFFVWSTDANTCHSAGLSTQTLTLMHTMLHKPQKDVYASLQCKIRLIHFILQVLYM